MKRLLVVVVVLLLTGCSASTVVHSRKVDTTVKVDVMRMHDARINFIQLKLYYKTKEK